MHSAINFKLSECAKTLDAKIILDPYYFPDIKKTDKYTYPEHFRSAWDAFTPNVPSWKYYLSDKFKNKERNIYSLTILESLFIGFLQVFTLIPGASRSGTIITAARILKLNRIDATKIALFSGIPTIIGAVSLEILWLINHNINTYAYINNKYY